MTPRAPPPTDSAAGLVPSITPRFPASADGLDTGAVVGAAALEAGAPREVGARIHHLGEVVPSHGSGLYRLITYRVERLHCQIVDVEADLAHRGLPVR